MPTPQRKRDLKSASKLFSKKKIELPYVIEPIAYNPLLLSEAAKPEKPRTLTETKPFNFQTSRRAAFTSNPAEKAEEYEPLCL